MNVALTDVQVEDLAKPLVRILEEFYQNPENEKGFQTWLQQKKQREMSIGETS